MKPEQTDMATKNSTKKKLDDLTRDELIELVKTLKKRKKYGLIWESKPEDVISQCKREFPVLEEVKDRVIEEAAGQPTNIIIEGDNYHALSVLNFTHAGKIDLIYIDPPYNTGAKDWKYNNDYVDINDTFRHSKWLSMMSNRLTLAKKLLKQDGVLICAIDENEHAHLGVMLEEMFPDKEVHSITIVHNPRGIQGRNFSYCHEYAYFVIPVEGISIGKRKIESSEVDWRNLRDNGGGSLRSDAKNCFYPMIVDGKGNVIDFGEVPEPKWSPKSQTEKHGNNYYIYPIDKNGIERKWRYARQSVESVKHLLRSVKRDHGYDIEIGKDFGSYKTVWIDPRYDSNEYGAKLVKKLVPKCDFNFPKSLWNTYDCLYANVANKKDAVILDFFAGSGTTGHAVLQLNEDDGGKRQFILVTNNENGIAEDCTYARIKKVVEGTPDQKKIPANLRYFKTTFVPRDEASDDTRRSLVKRCAEMLCVKEDTFKKLADKKEYKIFTNGKTATGILFDLDSIDEFKAKLEATSLPSHLYVFSLTDDVFSEEFTDLSIKHTLCPIPESILEVYRRLCD